MEAEKIVEQLTICETNETAVRRYALYGCCLNPPILSDDLVGRTILHMEAVMRCEYETNRKPMDLYRKPSDSPTKLCKIDQPHLADCTIREAITHSALGRRVADITGAKLVQVWAVQLLYKPSGGDTQGSVGWHQDYDPWKTWWTPDSEVFTAWLALSDVRPESGPMRFVAGSHRWGLIEGGDFWSTGDDHQRARMKVPDGQRWEEQSALMPAGAFSLHHRLTIHGSHPNVSQAPRRSFAIHLRTERSTPTPRCRRVDPRRQEGYAGVAYLDDVSATGGDLSDYVSYLDDPEICPVIYRAEES